jgi:hypothetical protein
VGGLRTSEDPDEVVGGEARSVSSDDNRKVDAPGRIIIDSAPITATPTPTRRAATPRPVAPQRAGGLGLVIVVYILAAAALGAAIYERFYM